jgi:maltooligosyltrehalose trehalohydrolase
VPDPQDEETFLRSRLSRREVPGVRDRYRRLLARRRTLPREVQAEAHGRTLTMRRGNVTLVANFDALTVEIGG